MDSDNGLARVTYLPGFAPPPEPVRSDTVRSDTVRSEIAPSEAGRSDVVPSEAGPLEAGPLEAAAGSDWEAEERRAESVSMHALTRRGMSRWELGEVLLSRELDVCIVESELDRLERVGLIDDAALAETIVRTQHERKGLGRSALIAELRKRRIDQDAIDEALEQLEDGDEQQRATALAERRAPQLSGLDRATAVRRLTGYLMRKGYSSTIIRTAVDQAMPQRARGVRFR